MCASSRLDQASIGLTGRGWNQFPPKTRLHHIWNVYKCCRVCLCCFGNWVWGRGVTALPSPSAAVSQWGLGGVLVPSCHTAPYKLRRCSNHQTWNIVASQTSVLRETGKSQWTNKKFNKQKRQSLRNISDPSPLILLSCANTVGKPFSWPCVLIPCTPLLFGMPPAALFRGCSLDGISYLGTGPYFSWDSAGKLIF